MIATTKSLPAVSATVSKLTEPKLSSWVRGRDELVPEGGGESNPLRMPSYKP